MSIMSGQDAFDFVWNIKEVILKTSEKHCNDVICFWRYDCSVGTEHANFKYD
jgi:hypothetical protein